MLLCALLLYLLTSVLLLGLTDASHIVDTNYEFSVVDSNSLLFVFKHAPEVAKELQIGSELSFETANFSHQENWMVCELSQHNVKS